MALERVESSRFPYLPLSIMLRGMTYQVEALIDTGFDGDVALSEHLLASDESPDGYAGWTLADGSNVYAPIYAGSVSVGRFPTVPVSIVVLGDEPIVGRGVVDRYRVTLEYGDRVIVEP